MPTLALQTAAAASSVDVELFYMLAALLFILGIKRLSRVKSARSGNLLASTGMLLAIAATLFLLWGGLSLWILLAGVAVGGTIGALLAQRVPMTAMPELVAFFNGMGGGASLFVALAESARFSSEASERAGALSETARAGVELGVLGAPAWIDGVNHGGSADFAIALVLSVLVGGVTLSGSFVAYGKLAGKVSGSRFGPLGGGALNVLVAAGAIAAAVWAAFFVGGGAGLALGMVALTLLALVLGVGLVVPIGGADMPVVISLLNSYSGVAAASTGFVLQNNLLIIAGSLVGASGLILTRIMCKAMNRSLASVLFGGFGEAAEKQEDSEYTSVKSTTPEEVAPLLEAARDVIFVPGYGLAVAQAQHKVRDLADLLQANGCRVRYAIHPVAGRMPGHMNVLLAEADVPYEQLFELDRINSEFRNADVAIVLGANDVCNPAASDPGSAIAGMPVLEVWDARTVVVIKRSLSPGYAGIKNELFEMPNALMLFADAKAALEQVITEYEDL